MELLQLKYFQTVAFTEHISKAAQQLKIAQPSLSLTIKRLEDELGTKLFIRQGRNIKLSSSGKIFLKHVNNIFTEIENAKMEIQSQDEEKIRTIKISISNPRFLTGLISEYISRFPNTKIQQGIGLKSGILKGLKKGDLDLGIAGPPIVDEEIESYVLIDEDVVLVLPSNHKLVGKSEIALSEVANEPFIALANNEEYRSFTTNLCERAGFTPINNFEVDSNLLTEIVKLDQGVAILPISVCKKLDLNYVKIADTDPTFTVGLSWIKDSKLSPAVSDFRDFIISYFRDNYETFKVH
ncbi:LysR family transcriptional regulator [Heyndrickxia oleronia]|jgi:DNA-binding transcriptional LysR family regulator|uniref:LysR family transcriptional regulator n=1 Tax=Heyndrickxia oleronia TaxID=38875 RepID=A0AAW6SZ66_9BACI|nr:LysR family transcriptional regulator [Heyndrickxia oleronia]MCI1592824.1 LysR family transcriptional regulator [Heyndrickxia oleronia]MCI1614793.1 LysR family transcriptional regulator [Heyndrickxia oleronia]MCI1762679.1 LysR family transcriptional regulator [Heyndrickxia oleronia]MCM3456222.1 LysR family transcriptional regulator [Heyndrickxia oleronia]MDH5162312.1 LysR family transcriptional regulator [Heyndrickxia oleronia]